MKSGFVQKEREEGGEGGREGGREINLGTL
jgi:hypothetical protein